MTTVQFFLVLAGFVGGGAILINVVLGAIVRLRALRNSEHALEIEARLDRIEATVEAIAIEVDRLSDARRSAALPEPRVAIPPLAQAPRVITPH